MRSSFCLSIALVFILSGLNVSSCARSDQGSDVDLLAHYENKVRDVIVNDLQMRYGDNWEVVFRGVQEGGGPLSENAQADVLKLWEEMEGKGLYRWYGFRLLERHSRSIDDLSNEMRSIVPTNLSWRLMSGELFGKGSDERFLNGYFSDDQVLLIVKHFNSNPIAPTDPPASDLP